MIKLLVRDTPESIAQENFGRIETYLNGESLLKGKFQFYDWNFELTSYPKTVMLRHKLGFKPLDIIQTYFIGPGALTWVYSDFTKDAVYVTVTGDCRIRAFLGRYSDEATI